MLKIRDIPKIPFKSSSSFDKEIDYRIQVGWAKFLNRDGAAQFVWSFLGETYIQQLTYLGWSDDDDGYQKAMVIAFRYIPTHLV